MEYAERQAQLRRMVDSARVTKRHLERVRHRISDTAIRHAAHNSGCARARSFGSLTSYWSKRDHEVRAEAQGKLEAAASNELGALEAKLARQSAAIDEFCRKHGINEGVWI